MTRPDVIVGIAARASTRPAVRILANAVGLSPVAQDFHTIMAVSLAGTSRMADAFFDVLEPGGAGIFISSSAAHMQNVPDALLPLLDDPVGPASTLNP